MAGSPILGVNHVGIVAHDALAVARFYRRAAGLRDWPELEGFGWPAAGGIALAGPNAGLRVLPGGAAPVRRPVSEAGWTHLCLQSPAIDALRAAFADSAAAFHGPLIDLGTGFLYCYARDPEHNVVELEAVAPVWSDPHPWIAHVNVACADLAAQGRFYAALFDAPVARSPRLAHDERLDRIADIDGVELRMAWVDAGNLQIELIHYSQPAALATGAQSSRRGPAAAGHAYVALEVTTLEAARKHLLACGGSLRADGAAVATAVAADPEGNALWLVERAALEDQGAALAQLAQPDITRRFAAARAQMQGRA
jgi:catechol 2,3-dioxygenase-like lactoylglutathione lyase family enzyme